MPETFLLKDLPVLAVRALGKELTLVPENRQGFAGVTGRWRSRIEALLEAIDRPAPELRAAARKEMGAEATTAWLDRFMTDAQQMKVDWHGILNPDEAMAANVTQLSQLPRGSGHRFSVRRTY